MHILNDVALPQLIEWRDDDVDDNYDDDDDHTAASDVDNEDQNTNVLEWFIISFNIHTSNYKVR